MDAYPSVHPFINGALCTKGRHAAAAREHHHQKVANAAPSWMPISPPRQDGLVPDVPFVRERLPATRGLH